MPTQGDSDTVASGEVADQLRQEFRDESAEVLQGLDLILDAGRNGHGRAEDIVPAFRRAAITLRGQAASNGYAALSAIAHRLDDYLRSVSLPFLPRVWDDLQRFLDTAQDLLAADPEASRDVSRLARGLPHAVGFDLKDIQIRNVEVMLVMVPGAQTHFVERELQQCGYRVSVVSDTIMALAMALQIKPDLIIVSAVMPGGLDGIDLAIGLGAMPSTRNIPMAVITSLDPGDERLNLLPKAVPIVHKSPSFGDDLFAALDRLFLI